MRRRVFWTPAQDRVLRRLYATTSTRVIAEQIGRTVLSTCQRARKLGLLKDPGMLRDQNRRLGLALGAAGAASRFPKGHVPANKGLRRPGWAPGRMSETQFKKGQKPHNWHHEIGATRLIDGYHYTKVAEVSPWTEAWKQTHYLLWRRAGRRIPKHHVVAFKNGDRTDIRIGNLECIHRRELAKRNHWKRLPKPLRDVIVLRVAIKRTMTRRLKHATHD